MPATLKSRIPEIIATLPPEVEQALRPGAEAIATEAKARVPVETGTLRDAIHVEKVDEGFSIVAGDNNAFYGHIVENGSVYTPAHPFLIPSAESQRMAVAAFVQAVLRTI